MQFSAAFVACFAALTIASPIQKRAGVLGTKTYNEISISGGVAGNGEAEALATFSALDLNDMANVDPADIAFLGAVNDIANAAEVGAFNPAIEAATGDAKVALINGKIKNKIEKLTATKLELMIKAAQGEDTSAKLAAEQKKLDNNIALDKKAAGQPSTKLSFDATTG